MKRRRRKIMLGLAAAGVAALLAGCNGTEKPAETRAETGAQQAGQTVGESQTEGSKEPVTITYWHHDASENIVTPLKKIIADFETENPDIKIDFLALPADSFYQKYVTAVATNTAPDVFGVRDTELLALVNQNAIIPLDDYVSQWEERDKIPDSIWNSVNSYTDNGKTYMIPSYMNACIMWYNVDRNPRIA